MKMTKRNIQVLKRRKRMWRFSATMFVIGFIISIILVGTSDWETLEYTKVFSDKTKIIMFVVAIISFALCTGSNIILTMTEK